MTRGSLLLLLGLTTFFSSPTVIKAETTENPNTENTNAQTTENDANLDQYFNRTNADTSDNNQPLSAQATTEPTAPAADGAATSTAPAGTATDGTTTPAKKVVKKKKKKAAAGAVATDTATVEGATGHGTQDSGLPYKANFDLGFKFKSDSATLKYADNSTKFSMTELGLDVTWLFIFSKMEAGPIFSYKSETTKIGDISIKENSMGIGGAFFMNFGNIHADKLVPYAGVSLKMNTETNDSTKETDKNTKLGLQGGMKYFVGAHLALKPFLSYEMALSGEKKDESTTPATVGSVTGSTLELGLGLAKYF
jgi:hypothetical protein